MRINFARIKLVIINYKIEQFYESGGKYNKERFYEFLGTTFEENPSYYTLYLQYIVEKGVL